MSVHNMSSPALHFDNILKPLPDALVTLRTELDSPFCAHHDDERTASAQQQEQEVPLLRWLRTTIELRGDVEQHRTALRLLPQTMVEHVVIGMGWSAIDFAADVRLHSTHHGVVLNTLLSLQCFMALNLRGLGDGTGSLLSDTFFGHISQRHARLRRLHLVPFPSLTQSCLNLFRHLVELDITGCKTINSVDFCADTLRVLYADFSTMNNKGLANAVHLEVLHVRDCPNVTSVAPFAETLRELDASGTCGISDSSLAHAVKLEYLNLSENAQITTLRPFCRLKEIIANGKNTAISLVAVSAAKQLERLTIIHRCRGYNHTPMPTDPQCYDICDDDYDEAVERFFYGLEISTLSDDDPFL